MSYERIVDKFIRARAMRLANRTDTAERVAIGAVISVAIVVGVAVAAVLIFA